MTVLRHFDCAQFSEQFSVLNSLLYDRCDGHVTVDMHRQMHLAKPPWTNAATINEINSHAINPINSRSRRPRDGEYFIGTGIT